LEKFDGFRLTRARMLKTKSIVLPSGARCQVRALQMADYIFAAGALPITDFLKLAQGRPKSAAEEGKTVSEDQFTPAEWDARLRLRRTVLLKCVGKVTHPGGLKQRIVDKPFDECGPDELAPELISDTDANEICNQVNSLVEIPKEVATNVATFPPEEERRNGAGPHGEAIREATNGVACPG
jgi:hypothetical protein